jgi:hypothetical protein
LEAGESEYSGVLKTRNLSIFRDAESAENCKIAPNWNVFGTRAFQAARQFREEDLPSLATASSFQVTLSPLASELPRTPFRASRFKSAPFIAAS